MNKKQLEIYLSKLKTLENKKIRLEQYQIEGSLAAEMLVLAEDDIKGKVVADLGCGNGILGIGALLLGVKKVYFVDLDKESIKIAKGNVKEFSNAEFFNCDIKDFNKKVDTVVMNPPFGVQKRKADKVFLETAMKIAENIYSIHKIESSKFIEALAKEYNFEIAGIVKTRFLLKKSYQFHKKKNYYVDIGIWILKRIK